jgi:hypothetical protein
MPAVEPAKEKVEGIVSKKVGFMRQSIEARIALL